MNKIYTLYSSLPFFSVTFLLKLVAATFKRCS